jgi:hypothetical protein
MDLYTRTSDVTQSAMGRLADGALFSSTANLDVATGPYGGEVLFVLSVGGGGGGGIVEGNVDEQGFELCATPAPVQWVSQFPAEEEYLWPAHTALIPKLAPGRRHQWDTAFPGKTTIEFAAAYLWDTRLCCIGRWRGIEADEADMARMTVKAATRGLGMQDLWMAVPGLLVDREIDDDYSLSDAVALAYSVFDTTDAGSVQLSHVLGLVEFFYGDIHGMSAHKLNRLIEPVRAELSALCGVGDTAISRERFCEYFGSLDYGVI